MLMNKKIFPNDHFIFRTDSVSVMYVGFQAANHFLCGKTILIEIFIFE